MNPEDNNRISKKSEKVLDFWEEVSKEIVKESIGSLEEATKQTVSTIGILSGLYINAVAFGDINETDLNLLQILIYALPLVCWLLGIYFAIQVRWNQYYKLDLFDAYEAKSTWEQIVNFKHQNLNIANIYLLLGLALATVAIIQYLTF